MCCTLRHLDFRHHVQGYYCIFHYCLHNTATSVSNLFMTVYSINDQ